MILKLCFRLARRRWSRRPRRRLFTNGSSSNIFEQYARHSRNPHDKGVKSINVNGTSYAIPVFTNNSKPLLAITLDGVGVKHIEAALKANKMPFLQSLLDTSAAQKDLDKYEAPPVDPQERSMVKENTKDYSLKLSRGLMEPV